MIQSKMPATVAGYGQITQTCGVAKNSAPTDQRAFRPAGFWQPRWFIILLFLFYCPITNVT